MTKLTNAFDSYTAIGIREDLADKIWDVTPSDTPIASAIQKTTATQKWHEWQTDALGSPSFNKQLEGDEIAASSVTATTRMGNYCQIAYRSFAITGSEEKANKAGRKSEVAYQLARRMEELKTDIEKSISGRSTTDTQKWVAGNATTARQMAAIQAYMTTNTVFGSGGADASQTTPGSAERTEGTETDFTEANLKTVLALMFTNGGTGANMMVLSPTNKARVSDSSIFTGGQTRYNTADDKKLVVSVDVYEGDYHTLKVVPSRIINSEDVLIIDPMYLAIAEYRKMHSFDLAKTGDNERKVVLWEGTLEVRNEKALGGVFDTNG